ncbi:MAG: SUMF1/EgtB/PvdO family nonheme iron enzyme [Deltaproteobacteria bacterium]|nr:SUMF1/EgtB/PvdO family nonheme iron enzyme [Deltaproteobacteria bacterium]
MDEWIAEEETEEIDREQILDVDTEIVDETVPLEETEIGDQDDIIDEAVEITDQDLATAEGEGIGQQDFPAPNTENLAGDEFAGMPIGGTGAQELAIPGAEQGQAAGLLDAGAGGQLPVDEWGTEEETEEINRELILDVDTEIVDEALPLAEAEIGDQEQILADDTAIAEKTAMAGTGGSPPSAAPRSDGRQESGQRLDLSHYIDADEALAALPETLVETHDEYIAQILDRFMPKFIRIPAGYYLTGRDRPSHNERPAKKILLQNFYISQLPVTNDLFDFFVRETGYETDAERTGFGTVVTGRICNSIDPQTGRNVLSISHGTRSQRMQGANWRHPQGPASSLENKANHPVVQVSRHDALAFAAWAGKRLPSEDEWEAAARGAFGFLFPWGNEWQGELANTESSLTGDTTPVTRHGKLSISPFGVYDLLGNVFEWTSTVAGPQRQATGNAPLIYVLKGGCWTSRTGTTAASRLLETETWSNIIGFRCAV